MAGTTPPDTGARDGARSLGGEKGGVEEGRSLQQVIRGKGGEEDETTHRQCAGIQGGRIVGVY